MCVCTMSVLLVAPGVTLGFEACDTWRREWAQFFSEGGLVFESRWWSVQREEFGGGRRYEGLPMHEHTMPIVTGLGLPAPSPLAPTVDVTSITTSTMAVKWSSWAAAGR